MELQSQFKQKRDTKQDNFIIQYHLPFLHNKPITKKPNIEKHKKNNKTTYLKENNTPNNSKHREEVTKTNHCRQ